MCGKTGRIITTIMLATAATVATAGFAAPAGAAVTAGSIMTGLGVGAGVATAGLTYDAAVSQQEAQQRYQNQLTQQQDRQRLLTKKAVEDNYSLQSERMQVNQLQQATQNNAALLQAKDALVRQQATQRVASAEAGASGVSLQALQAQTGQEYDQYTSALMLQQQGQMEQNRFDMRSLRAQGINQFRSISPFAGGPIETPSFWAYGLQGATNALGNYYALKSPNNMGTYNYKPPTIQGGSNSGVAIP